MRSPGENNKNAYCHRMSTRLEIRSEPSSGIWIAKAARQTGDF